jgi:hypothetical protein
MKLIFCSPGRPTLISQEILADFFFLLMTFKVCFDVSVGKIGDYEGIQFVKKPLNSIFL